MKSIIAFICLCICAAYAGVPLGLHAPAVGYAAPIAAVGYAAPIAHVAAAPVAFAAPVVHHAVPVAVAAPALYVDNTHFSYGYQNPFGNGHVSVARTGPIDAHSYTFRSGTWVKK